MPYNSNSDGGYKISNVKRGEAGSFVRGHHTDKQLQEAVETEREACALLCDKRHNSRDTDYSLFNTAIICAEAIRKRRVSNV